MAEKLFLEVVTPQKAIVSEEVEIVVAPGSEGEFGVLKGHTTFLTSLKIGTLRYKDTKGKERFLFINGGFAEVLPNKVTILAESAERRQNIDVERAKMAKDRAEKRLSEKREDTDIVRAEAALRRAVHRLKIK
ncbi:MAG: F0F1 ATP synthase subunit epsilon [Desulfobacula sp.]|jgi:F-type H+-transporting ATPase subunit epsilon|uniref:F0F1 ATP synthase subunit epsilon n=1 Tax=Desulfobacula sp. TaxID=2593537 RepID=UPI001D209F14|nr:F0F1 ATP synthase subunit epsilon [Desulfobacula sp.]MBT3485928.1 F0F1 ATP synthase subunit epsilon [Desulfobacula sp.]MBT3805426.1 F0F1 ATP synthase subunit epsilon [Desulfobacula sp.]MBT4026005.1 F0F1 ATP synthase subunit epsilon [Desulfobacula sp.]MBT4199076.1 F0F1 ATP synthase subunit epsilon [Desulfobacula sp.]